MSWLEALVENIEERGIDADGSATLLVLDQVRADVESEEQLRRLVDEQMPGWRVVEVHVYDPDA